MNVLSFFDGIAFGLEALKRIDVKVDNYFASEIDKDAIQIAMKNHPEIIQIGDVQQIKPDDLPKIDLLIGGSPCQGFSEAGKGLNFQDERSKLFFDYVRLLNEINPTYFKLENVRMKKEWKNIITNYMKVYPFEINSSLVSGQGRKRLYWTNIDVKYLPVDKNISFGSVLEKAVSFDKYGISPDKLKKILDYRISIGDPDVIFLGNNRYEIRGEIINVLSIKTDTIHTNFYNIPCATCTIIRKSYQTKRFKNSWQKSYTLTTIMIPGVLTNGYLRKLTPIEYERLQTLPDNYTEGLSDRKRYKAVGNAWTVDVVAHIFQFLKYPPIERNVYIPSQMSYL